MAVSALSKPIKQVLPAHYITIMLERQKVVRYRSFPDNGTRNLYNHFNETVLKKIQLLHCVYVDQF